MGLLDESIRQQLRSPYAASPTGALLPPVGPSSPADYSAASVMNPFGRLVPSLLGPLIREGQYQQQGLAAARSDPASVTRLTDPNLIRHALNMVMAFGPGITKEQREAWETENEVYRTARKVRDSERGATSQNIDYPSGTRVKVRSTLSRAEGYDPEAPFSEHEGTVVTPGTPGAGIPAKSGQWYLNQQDRVIPKNRSGTPGKYTFATSMGGKPIRPEDSIAVRPDGDTKWYWRHPSQLEVMAPEEFPPGTKVNFKGNFPGGAPRGEIIDPEKIESPDPKLWLKAGEPDWYFVRVSKAGQKDYYNWFHKDDMVKVTRGRR